MTYLHHVRVGAGSGLSNARINRRAENTIQYTPQEE
jgi:hypothetical protein